MIAPARLDLYEILQVHPLAEPEVIEAAYRRLCRKYHPDVNQSPDAVRRTCEINAAYEVLRDPVRRRAYDAQLRSRTPTPSPMPPPWRGGRAVRPERTRHTWTETPPNPAAAASATPPPAARPPQLIVHESAIDLGPLQGWPTAVGQSPRVRFKVSNAGGSLLVGSVLTGAPWLRVNPQSFATNGLWVEIWVETRGLAPDTDYHTELSVKTNGGDRTVPVRFRLLPPAVGRLVVGPATVELLATDVTGPTRGHLQLRSDGPAAIHGVLRPSHPWLRLNTTEFHGTSIEVGISVDPALLPDGAHQAFVAVESSGGSAVVPVRVRVSHGGALLEVTPEAIDFGSLGPERPKTHTVEVHSVGMDLLSGQALARGDWLEVNPATFEGNHALLQVTTRADQLHGFWSCAGLDAQPIAGAIEIVSSGGTVSIPVRAVLRRSEPRRSWPFHFFAEA